MIVVSEAPRAGEKYLNFQVENVWPQQKVFMNYVYEDGTLGTMHWSYSNEEGVSTDRMRIMDVTKNCHNLNLWMEHQPFYTEYEHCN